MQHLYRDMLDYWQAVHRQLWAGSAGPGDERNSGAVAPAWFGPSMEDVGGLQRAWLESCRDAVKLAGEVRSLNARTLLEARDSWARVQAGLWNGYVEGCRAVLGLAPPASAPEAAPRARPRRAPAPARMRGQARRGPRDDLKKIAGIGPTLERRLNGEGIVSFRQLAELTKSDIERLEKTVIRFPGRITRENWVGQARKLSRP